MSERQACKLLEVDRSTYRSQPRPDHNAGLREALIALAREKPRFGYRRLWVELTRKQGWTASIGRVHRLSRAEHLAVRRLKRKRLKGVMPANPLLTRPNQEWALDFVSDALSNRTRAACADHGGQLHAGVPGDRGGHGDLQPAGDADIGTGDSGTWQAAHSALRQRGGVTSRHILGWCADQGIELVHIQPGRPMQNGRVESFNGRFRDECLNANWFVNLADARDKIERWRQDYNFDRPPAVWIIGLQMSSRRYAQSSPAGWSPSHRSRPSGVGIAQRCSPARVR